MVSVILLEKLYHPVALFFFTAGICVSLSRLNSLHRPTATIRRPSVNTAQRPPTPSLAAPTIPLSAPLLIPSTSSQPFPPQSSLNPRQQTSEPRCLADFPPRFIRCLKCITESLRLQPEGYDYKITNKQHLLLPGYCPYHSCELKYYV